MKVGNTVLPAHTYSPEKTLRENFNNSFEAYVQSFQQPVQDAQTTSATKRDTNPTTNSDVKLKTTDGKELPANLIDPGNLKLIIPNKENMQHMLDMTQRLLQDIQTMHNIPLPESISYNDHGELVLPNDYPFKEEFKQALEEHPIAGHMLQTTYAMSTHYTALEERKPMVEELQAAATQAQIDAIIQKYSRFLDDNYQGPATSLSLAKSGVMNVMSNGDVLL